MPSSAPSEVRRLLRRLDLTLSKKLGQHLLVDRRALQAIVAAADLSPEDVVVEVGAGPGILTEELLRQAGRVIAVEVDPRMVSALRERFAGAANLTVVEADVLQLDPAAVVAGPNAAGSRGYKLVANLPYYIASAVLRHFLEAAVKPRLMVVTVQKEVAQSIVAAPGQMGLLSVSVQVYGRPRIVAQLPPRAFYPPPKVASAAVRIEVYPEPRFRGDLGLFFRTVKAGFSAPRKQLRNALAQGLGVAPADAARLLELAKIDPTRRAQTVTLEEWERLAHSLTSLTQEGSGVKHQP